MSDENEDFKRRKNQYWLVLHWCDLQVQNVQIQRAPHTKPSQALPNNKVLSRTKNIIKLQLCFRFNVRARFPLPVTALVLKVYRAVPYHDMPMSKLRIHPFQAQQACNAFNSFRYRNICSGEHRPSCAPKAYQHQRRHSQGPRGPKAQS